MVGKTLQNYHETTQKQDKYTLFLNQESITFAKKMQWELSGHHTA